MQSVRIQHSYSPGVLNSIAQLAAQPRLSAADIAQARKQLNLSRSRLYQLIRQFRIKGNIDVRTSRGKGLPKGTSLLPDATDAMLKDVLQNAFLSRQRPRVSRVMRLLQVEARKRGLKCPSRGTVQNRIDQLDRRVVIQSREGRKAADDKMRPVVNSLLATRPLELVQVDHTLADVIVVDEETRRPLQRPWLTVLIDVATRMVAGYYLSLDPPSTTSVALALQHAVLPKDEWMKQRGLDAVWPVAGLPETLHMDNAKEFHSLALTKGLRNHNIKYWYRPVRRPHFGGHIERLIGTIMWDMHDLPGTTFSNIAERGAYESEKRAAMTLDELDRWLAVYITGYHNRVHHSILRPPLAVWNELAAREGHQFRHPSDREAFYLDFLPAARRMIRRDGIKLFNIAYWDDVLSAWAARSKLKYWVRYDPRNMAHIFLQDPEGHYWRIRTRYLGRPQATLSELKSARKTLRDQGRSEVDEEMVFHALEAQRLIVDDAVGRTVIARRKQQRVKQALIKCSSPIPTITFDQAGAADIAEGPAVPFDVEEWS